MQDSDRILIEAHLRGDSGAFETLVRRYGPAVYGFLLKMVKDTHKADDLFQDTFGRVCQKAGQFRGEQLKPWIFAIAVNAAMYHFRKEKLNPTASLNSSLFCEDGYHCPAAESAVCGIEDNPARTVELEEKRAIVREALTKLPEQQRAALVLCYYQKMSYQEIAETLKCSVGTVKTHVFRALKRLATLLPTANGGLQ